MPSSSGTGVVKKMSSSSSVSRLLLGCGEEGGGGGSQEAMRRWDLARARAVRLVRMEAAVSGVRGAEEEGGAAGVIGVGEGWEGCVCVCVCLRGGGFFLAGMFWLYWLVVMGGCSMRAYDAWLVGKVFTYLTIVKSPESTEKDDTVQLIGGGVECLCT